MRGLRTLAQTDDERVFVSRQVGVEAADVTVNLLAADASVREERREKRGSTHRFVQGDGKPDLVFACSDSGCRQ